MLDLNDFRVFEKVAKLKSFSAAARALGLPKSSVSRCVARLEDEVGIRLIQRTTRSVQLTESGLALEKRCVTILASARQTIDYVSSLGTTPKGLLRISAGIGFAYHILSETLPKFLEQFPDIDVSLDVTNRSVDLVAEGVDITIRMGHMPDSRLVAVGLGTIRRYLYVAPEYLARRGPIGTIEELQKHDTVEMPGINGKPRVWTFHKAINEVTKLQIQPRLSVNDPGLIHRLVVNGAGVGCLSAYMCVREMAAGRLVRLFPDWSLPHVDVSVVFPSSRALSPAVRAFVEHMKNASVPGKLWRGETLAAERPLKRRRTSKAKQSR